MRVYHHNDWDGLCSAAIVYACHPEEGVTFVEVDYDAQIDFDLIKRDEQVVIVDFSFERDGDWQRLFKKTHDVIWIDHHESAIKRAMTESVKDGNWPLMQGLRTEERCGAWLTWEYFMPDQRIPSVVRAIDKWDRWKHNDDPSVLDFIAGLEIQELHPLSPLWDRLLFSPQKRVLAHMESIRVGGRYIRLYKDTQAKREVKGKGYVVEWEGYTCFVINSSSHGSKVFESIKDIFDINISWQYGPDKFIVSLVSGEDGPKVNEIAEKYKGGGHPHAAGFVCEKLPF